jgi:hypothetical protein
MPTPFSHLLCDKRYHDECPGASPRLRRRGRVRDDPHVNAEVVDEKQDWTRPSTHLLDFDVPARNALTMTAMEIGSGLTPLRARSTTATEWWSTIFGGERSDLVFCPARL